MHAARAPRTLASTMCPYSPQIVRLGCVAGRRAWSSGPHLLACALHAAGRALCAGQPRRRGGADSCFQPPGAGHRGASPALGRVLFPCQHSARLQGAFPRRRAARRDCILRACTRLCLTLQLAVRAARPAPPVRGTVATCAPFRRLSDKPYCPMAPPADGEACRLRMACGDASARESESERAGSLARPEAIACMHRRCQRRTVSPRPTPLCRGRAVAWHHMLCFYIVRVCLSGPSLCSLERVLRHCTCRGANGEKSLGRQLPSQHRVRVHAAIELRAARLP